MRALRRVLVAAFVIAGVIVAPGDAPLTAASATRADGMVSDITWYIPRADMDREIAMMRDAGVKWIRANVNWASVEPNGKGQIDQWWLNEIDYAVSKAQAAGIQILMPISDGVPYWASADPARYSDGSGNHWNRYYKPRSFQDYADFAKAIVSRYAPKGVHAYEVWNEPNYSRFWPSGPSASDYTAMLRAAYPAIKSADPSSTVLMGGLSRNDFGFLGAMYNAGARSYFDAVAVHPYTGKTDPTLCWNDSAGNRSIDAFCGIESVRAKMVAYGDSAKNIWLTEFGWSTASGASNGVSEAVQADYLTKSFKKLDSYGYVTHAFWYSMRNNYWSNNDQGDLEANYGVARVDYSVKPSYAAFKNLAAASAPTTSTTVQPTTSTTAAPATTTTTSPPSTTTTLPTTDTSAPVISNVFVGSIGKTSATVRWSTNEGSTTVVEYWTSSGTVRTASNPSLVTSHSQGLSSLSRGTTYSYRVTSVDASGNAAVSGVSTFKTRR